MSDEPKQPVNQNWVRCPECGIECHGSVYHACYTGFVTAVNEWAKTEEGKKEIARIDALPDDGEDMPCYGDDETDELRAKLEFVEEEVKQKRKVIDILNSYINEVRGVCYKVHEPEPHPETGDDPRTVVGIVEDTLAIKDKEIRRLQGCIRQALIISESGDETGPVLRKGLD